MTGRHDEDTARNSHYGAKVEGQSAAQTKEDPYQYYYLMFVKCNYSFTH